MRGTPLAAHLGHAFFTAPLIARSIHQRGRVFQIAMFWYWISLAPNNFGGSAMSSILKVRTSGTESLIEKIKAEIKKRAEAKAKRMFLRRPKRLAKR
jgi:hypothetical protein